MRYMVVDTNIFINYLDILQVFVEDCERTNAPVVVVVPGIVISELDGWVALLYRLPQLRSCR